MTGPPPLPVPVPFPVYGLRAEYAGVRELVLWNEPGWLWTVTLAHGVEGEALLVTTIRREPRPPAEGDAWERQPNDLEVAAVDAVTSAVERAALDRSTRKDVLEAELDRIYVSAGGVVLDGWDGTTVRVDGASVAARTRVVAGTRVVVLDLPTVVVAVELPGVDAAPLHLADVRDRLADYPWP